MKSIFRKIFSLLTPGERRHFYLLVLFNSLVCIADILALAVLVFVIGFYTQKNTEYLAFLPSPLLDANSINLVLVFFVLFAIKSVAGIVAFHLQFRYVYNVATRMATHNLSSYLHGSYDAYSQIPPATHMRHISDHTIQFGHYVLFGAYQVITECIIVLLTVIAILLFNAQVFVILLLILVPPVLLAGLYTRRKLKQARSHVKQSSEASLQHLQEALRGYVESNIYQKSTFFLRRFEEQQGRFNRFLSDVHISQGLPTRLIEVFAVLGLLVVIALNNISGGDNTQAIINIGAFMAVAYKLIPGIVRISNLTAQLRTYDFIITDMMRVSPIAQATGASESEKIRSIRFENVSHSYTKENNPVLINHTINNGVLTGISGDSGRGKTTIVNLLCGFITPSGGSIYINQRKVSGTDLIANRRNVSYVKQHAFLIHDSILRNITLDDTAEEEQRLSEILSITGIDALAAQMPEGILTRISDDGKNISGGQRQRIAIARALYKEADIIILDEAFSELDHTTEAKLIQYFKDLAHKGKIVLLITHNPAGLKQCDDIIYL